MTIIRITAHKSELSIQNITQTSSKVRIECGRDEKQDEGRLAVHRSQADKTLSSDGNYKAINHCENLGQGRYEGSVDDVTASGNQIKSEVKSEPETKNIIKCLVSDQIDNPMTTCANKFIRRTKSVVANNKEEVEVRFSASSGFLHLKTMI